MNPYKPSTASSLTFYGEYRVIFFDNYSKEGFLSEKLNEGTFYATYLLCYCLYDYDKSILTDIS